MNNLNAILYWVNAASAAYGVFVLWRGNVAVTPTMRRALAVLALVNLLAVLPHAPTF